MSRMESLRLICDREIPVQQQRIDSFAASFRSSLESIKAKAQETTQFQGKAGQAKAALREAEDELVKALAAKTRKEAKRIATLDSIAAAKARIEELKRNVQELKAERDDYATIISKHSKDLLVREEKANGNCQCKVEIEEAISWYNRFLGFRIECGHGVKFVFKNISSEDPDKEYFFTIRHSNDKYTLLDCNPQLNETKELVDELNKTNGLFKFVRTMRQKFQESATEVPHQDLSSMSLSGPALSGATEKSGYVSENVEQVQHGKINRQIKKGNRVKGSKVALFSPGSAYSLRSSPRFKVKK